MEVRCAMSREGPVRECDEEVCGGGRNEQKQERSSNDKIGKLGPLPQKAGGTTGRNVPAECSELWARNLNEARVNSVFVFRDCIYCSASPSQCRRQPVQRLGKLDFVDTVKANHRWRQSALARPTDASDPRDPRGVYLQGIAAALWSSLEAVLRPRPERIKRGKMYIG